MKKFILFVSVLLILVLLTSCVKIKAIWIIKENGDVSSIVGIKADMVSKEDLYTSFTSFLISVPQVLKDFDFEDWSDMEEVFGKLDYTEEGLIIIPHSTFNIFDLDKILEIRNITFTKKKFILELPKLEEGIEELSSPNEDVLTLVIKFPREIDIANTSYINKNVAMWVINKKLLKEGFTLKVWFK